MVAGDKITVQKIAVITLGKVMPNKPIVWEVESISQQFGYTCLNIKGKTGTYYVMGDKLSKQGSKTNIFKILN